jgi:rRNA maturation endonuclease Nob1
VRRKREMSWWYCHGCKKPFLAKSLRDCPGCGRNRRTLLRDSDIELLLRKMMERAAKDLGGLR